MLEDRQHVFSKVTEEDITRDLSPDPTRREQQLYDRILDASRRIKASREDPTAWEGKTYVRLMHLLKQGDERSSQAVWNAVLLVLALCAPEEQGVALPGEDFTRLAMPDQERALASLREIFPSGGEANPVNSHRVRQDPSGGGQFPPNGLTS